MITIGEQIPGQEIAPLPPLVSARDLLSDALPLLRPVNRMTVTDAAERYVRVQTGGVWQQFDRNVTPYMVEPADVTQSRLYRCAAFVGPSQSGKTFMLVTTSLHAVKCDPAPVQIIHMTKTDGDAWVEESLNPTIFNSPEINEHLGRNADDSTFSRKRFKGMRLSIGIPVANQLSSRKQRMVLLTDYDHMPQRLGPKDQPEGSPHSMALQRIKSFMSRGTVVVESTPAFSVTDPSWEPTKAEPHEMPPVSGGIVPIYNSGTRARWMWECRDCHGHFEPRFDRLLFDEKLDPMSAGEGAKMQCPHCGCLSPHSHKRENNRKALQGHGGWFHEGQNGMLVRLGDPQIRQTDTVSYALNGAAATFASWANMVSNFLTAKRAFETDSDDLLLRQFYFTDCGVPFAPVDEGEADGLTLKMLKADRLLLAKSCAPSWTRFLTISVDVQGAYFPVQVMAWGLDGRRTVIDRFDLTQPMDGAERKLDPGKYASDWDVLVELGERVFPVDGETYGLRAVALVVDFQGAPGVSDNAEKFYRKRRANNEGKRWFLSRGQGGFDQRDRVWHVAPERSNNGTARKGIKLLNMATDRLKDTVLAGLNRPPDVADAFPLPEWMEDDPLNEFIAEKKGDKGYVLKPGRKRNESLDLAVQAQAVAEFKGVRRINPEAPPEWMGLDPSNPFFASQVDDAAPKSKRPRQKSPSQINFMSKGR